VRGREAAQRSEGVAGSSRCKDKGEQAAALRADVTVLI